MPDVYLNSNALGLHALLGFLADSLAFDGALVATWAKALKAGLTYAWRQSTANGGTFRDWDALAFAYLGLGPEGWPDAPDALSFATLQGKTSSLSLAGRMRVALAYVLRRDAMPLDVLTWVREDLVGLVRVQGRTAYISAGPGQDRAAGKNNPKHPSKNESHQESRRTSISFPGSSPRPLFPPL